jgi:hypothetical protein
MKKVEVEFRDGGVFMAARAFRTSVGDGYYRIVLPGGEERVIPMGIIRMVTETEE